MSARTRNIIVGVVVAVLLVTVVGPFVYLNFIQEDAPDRLTVDDVTSTTTDDGGAPADEGIEGSWTLSDESVVGYRIEESLFGQSAVAVGQASGVTGEAVVDGTTVTEATFEVDMTTFESDSSRRDSAFDGRIMGVDEFPTATFVLTEPIELGSEPADGADVSVTATGDLTLHGVTRQVSIDLTARRSGASFAVDGALPITFTDYDIDDPSGGPASVGDEGDLEVLLVFQR